MTIRSSTRWLPLAVALALAACSGDQGTPVAPTPTPAPAPAPEVARQDTAAPAETKEDEAARKRREFFEHIDKEGAAPAVAPEPAAAPAPEPAVAAGPKVAPAPKVAAAPKPKPAPAVVATRPKPKPAPLPKPTASPPGGVPTPTAVAEPPPKPASEVAATAPEPVPETAPASETADGGDAVAMAGPRAAQHPGTSEPIPLHPSEDPVQRCGEPSDLQEAASRGALSNADLTCLNEAYGLAPSRLGKERVSVLLLTDAYAAGDKAAQEDLLKRHLTEVDPENPELAYRYALVLVQKGPDHARQVVHWASVALTNRAGWTGDTYKQRVNSLYKLRAAASEEALKQAEADYKTTPGTDTERAVSEARDDTKRYAREWYSFAKSTGQATDAALDLCLVASQSADWCLQGS